MAPDALHTLTAICSVLEKVGTWPIGTVLLIVLIGPWVFAMIVSRAEERRVEALKQMYESNVELVKDYHKLAEDLTETVRLNTAQWSSALGKIDTNQFCPLNRTKKHTMENVT